MVISIDPGLVTGWALWGDDRLLVACGLGDPRSSPLHRVADVSEVWIETPVIYPRSKARSSDIIKLARTAGEWGGVYRVFAADVNYVEPAQWKGQLSKQQSHALAWSALAASERDVVTEAGRGVAASRRHNMLDAVALGVWVRKRTIPTAGLK